MMFVVPKKKKKKSLINRFPFMVIKKEGTPRYACFWAKLTTSKLENWESVLLRLLKSKYNDGHSFCTSLCYMQLVLIVCMHRKSVLSFVFVSVDGIRKGLCRTETTTEQNHDGFWILHGFAFSKSQLSLSELRRAPATTDLSPTSASDSSCLAFYFFKETPKNSRSCIHLFWLV